MQGCRNLSQTYFDDVKSLVNGSLGIKGEASIDFGRDFARNDLEDLLAELDQKTIEGGVNLLVEVFALYVK